MDNDEENRKAKIDATLETYRGNITINFFEIIKELSDEQKKELVSDGGWWSFIEEEMASDIVDEFSREGYNEAYTRLRTKILNSESMPKLIREWAIAMIESNQRAKEAEDYWSHAYTVLHHWVGEYSRDMWKIIPRLPDRQYNRPYTKDQMDDVEAKIKEWGLLFPEPSMKNKDDEYEESSY
jgi:hypothetical protein